MTLTTLHTLSDEPEDTVTLMVAEELASMPAASAASSAQRDWDELPTEFQPLSLRETLRHLLHMH